MLNAMSLTVLRQFFMRCLTRPFPAMRMPDSMSGALQAAAEGKVALNPAVPRWGRFRGRLNYDRAKCIGCGICAQKCPRHLITVDGVVPEIKKPAAPAAPKAAPAAASKAESAPAAQAEETPKAE